MNRILFSIFVASFAILASALPKPDEQEPRFVAQALEKARQVRKCITDNKDDPEASRKVPRCILAQFGVDTLQAKENFKNWLQTAGTEVHNYFEVADKESREFFESAKAKLSGVFDTIGGHLQNAKDKVHGWLDKLLGKSHDAPEQTSRVLRQADEQGPRFVAQALEKARAVRKCITDNKDDPEASRKVPRCILGQFGVDTLQAKENFKNWVQNAGSEVHNYFEVADKESREFFESAKAKLSGIFDTIGTHFQNAKDKVHGWLDKVLGKSHDAPEQPTRVLRQADAEESARSALNAYLDKAKAVAKCISQHHEDPEAQHKIPDCILEVFSVDPKAAKAKFEEWLKNQPYGKVAEDYFRAIGGKVEEFYKIAKAKVGGVLDFVGDTVNGWKNQVVGWVNRIVG